MDDILEGVLRARRRAKQQLDIPSKDIYSQAMHYVPWYQKLDYSARRTASAKITMVVKKALNR